MKRILSGIQPSGDVTLGNYLGAMKRWSTLEQTKGGEYFYFVPNLHALTNRPNPDELKQKTLSAVAWLLALGIDHKRSHIYVQSQIPQHSELMWILSNYTGFGELSRMTQFKDKSQKLGPQGQVAGLFLYPVLMAADILLYDADEVPVGQDQIQHVELARDIAERFNKVYGPTFRVPKATVQDSGAKIMDLQDPTKKMSKSDGTSNLGCIFLTDSSETMKQKIIRAVTDSSGQIRFRSGQPAVSNLLTIYSLLSDRPIEDIEKSYHDSGYQDFKSDLAELLIKVLDPVQKRFQEIMDDQAELEKIIEMGSDKAADLADTKLVQVKTTLGLL
ncbi:MAG TPA: tryptophan--tRNA ligase [Candidatus Saccharimonadales bacterium]|nr:tryptophan--tRNA ligase [Candidatus Saccharimonadales bacterium]